MKQLPLELEGSWVRLDQQLKNFSRKYHTVEIDNSCEWSESAIKVLSRHGKEARLLELSDCDFDMAHIKVLNKLFGVFEGLEELKICNASINVIESEINKIKPVNMARLKTVVLSEFHFGVRISVRTSREILKNFLPFQLLQFIRTTQLSCLKINEWSTGQDSSMLYLAGYLADQKCLEQLAMRDSELDIGAFSASHINRMTFPLKSLSLRKHSRTVCDEQNMKEFFKRFSNTLEELELGNSFPDSIYEMIFKKFLKLKYLKVNIAHAPKENVFYHNLQANSSVKKLVVQGYKQQHLKSLQGFIGNLPNIETLVMCDSSEVTKGPMIFFTNNLLKIHTLCLTTIKGNMLKGVNMPSVKSLIIESLPKLSHHDWKAIVKAFRNLEKLEVGSSYEACSLSDLMFNIITKGFKKLKHIELGYGFNAKKRIFNQILKNCRNIRTVNIFESAFDNIPEKEKDSILEFFKKPGLRFIINSYPYLHDVAEAKTGSLWDDEALEFDSDESDEENSDEDPDYDEDEAFAIFNGLMHAMGGDFDDSSDEHNEFIYFDSDGEMQRWDEDPYDYLLY